MQVIYAVERDKRIPNMKMKICPLCGAMVPELLYDLHRSADDLVISRMKRDFPGWSEHDGVCDPCLERYQSLNKNAA